MHFKKNPIFIFLSALLIFSTQLLTGSQINDYENFKFEHLKNIASKKGYVRVIIKMEVPGIEELTTYSTSFKTGNKDNTLIQAAFDADLALDDAISMTRNAILHKLNGMPYRINRTFSTLPCVALSVPEGTLEILKSLPEVLRIEEDIKNPLPKTEETVADNGKAGVDKPLLNQTIDIVGADVAWGLGFTGQGWYVAVLDTGILTSHEMFQGKNIVEHCFSLGENWYDRENGGCPNGLTEMDGPGSATHYENRFGHGSHVTGIAAGNNQNDRFGVAKDANIIAVQVFTYFSDEDDVLSWDSDQLRGLEYIYELRNTYNIASVNMSIGGADKYSNYCDTDLRAAAIANLRAAGIATTVASGNSSYCDGVNAPACISSAVAVNSTNKSDTESYFGNWHDVMVELMAPGESIISADPGGNSNYRGRSGTSMSTPHVAGAWAIIKQFDGNLDVDEIVSLFKDSGRMISSPRCPAAVPEYRINVGDAIISLVSLAPPKNLSGQQETNKSLLQTEYINELTWESNPLNADKNITNYRLYVVEGDVLTRIGQVDSSTFLFWHRGVGLREETTYAITAVDDEGEESLPYYYTLDFGFTTSQ